VALWRFEARGEGGVEVAEVAAAFQHSGVFDFAEQRGAMAFVVSLTAPLGSVGQHFLWFGDAHHIGLHAAGSAVVVIEDLNVGGNQRLQLIDIE
jgi:hypothetical protein